MIQRLHLMFLSGRSNKDDDFDELVVVREIDNHYGLHGDCAMIILSFLDPESDYAICNRVLSVSKHLRFYFQERNPFSLGVFMFRVKQPKFLRGQVKKYVYQLTVNNQKYAEKFDDSMLRCFPNLQKLILSSPGRFIKNVGFSHIPNLRYLEIDCSHMKFERHNTVINSNVFNICSNLEKVFLWNVSTEFMKNSSLRNLNNLEVFYCSGDFVTNKVLKMIPRSVKKIRFYGCENITDSGFKNLHSSLEMVAIRKCPNIHPIVEDYLRKINKNISVHYDNFKEIDERAFGGLSPPEERFRGRCDVM